MFFADSEDQQYCSYCDFITSLGNAGFYFSCECCFRATDYGLLEVREGFNMFLKMMGITFRRDSITKRPRVNKLGSNKDTYQKRINEYYYIPK